MKKKPTLTVIWRNKIIFFKGTSKQLSKEIETLKQKTQ